jgi:ABC-type proline/glycine betaine transport system permease subunit
MPSTFETFATGLTSPAQSLLKITKADAVLAKGVCRALLVGTAGTANIVDAGGATWTGVPLQQGYNPLMVQRVLTGGTADDIWALY